LKIIDLMCSTEYVKMCKYDTLRKGRNILKKLGVESTFELIEQYIEEVEFPIPGDIWVDDYESSIMSVYISNRILVVDEQHTHFELDFPTDGKFYRVRSSNG
ncbi:ornithine carbamoyltransferase, partial [Serratia marcescens]